MRIGVFGGTFDPPHIGHQILAADAAAQLALDRVLWVLTPTPPHKLGSSISADRTRLRLVRAAAADNPLFEVSIWIIRRMEKTREAKMRAEGTWIDDEDDEE